MPKWTFCFNLHQLSLQRYQTSQWLKLSFIQIHLPCFVYQLDKNPVLFLWFLSWLSSNCVRNGSFLPVVVFQVVRFFSPTRICENYVLIVKVVRKNLPWERMVANVFIIRWNYLNVTKFICYKLNTFPC